MNQPAIAVEGLSFRYAGRKRPALRDVSFQVEPGETLLVLGPSGCGKSTLTLCLSGLIPAAVAGEQRGRVVVDGSDTAVTPVAELASHVGLVFQDPDSQFCMLRVDDEVAFGLENLRVPPAEMTERITRALASMGLAGAEGARIDRLSGGGRQRLALASILATRPKILVFDEPTANLDPAGAADVAALLAGLKAEGNRAMVIVEHRLEHLAPLIDRVLVLGSDGDVLAHGPPAEVFRERAAELAALGVWIPPAAELANCLSARGISLHPYPLTLGEAEAAIRGELRQLSIEGDPPGPKGPLQLGAAVHGREATPPRGNDAMLDGGAIAGNGPSLVASGLSENADLASRPAQAEPAIQIEHLTWQYPSGPVALRDVSLVVPAGSFFALVGPNGAGKSTLAKQLIGSLRPPRETIRLFGRDARALDPSELARLVGYVFQNPEHQFVAGTVADELAYGLRPRKRPEAEVAERVAAMLEQFGLSSLAGANPFRLSFGEKRRLSVAAMLILGQRILILDEPTFGQDRRNTDALLSTLVEQNRAGGTIVVITHDVRLVAQYANDVAVLVEGEVAFQGSPDDLFRDALLVHRARLELPPMLELSQNLGSESPGFPRVASADALVEALEPLLAHSQRAESGAAGGKGR